MTQDNMTGVQAVVDYNEFLINTGEMHSVDHMFDSIDVSSPSKTLVVVPSGTLLHYTGKYYSKFGGYGVSVYNPTITDNGTEVTPINCKTNLPVSLKSKFYYGTAATGGSGGRPIGISGGANLAGTGSGGTDGSIKLILAPGAWLLTITPYADSSRIIVNAIVHEETI